MIENTTRMRYQALNSMVSSVEFYRSRGQLNLNPPYQRGSVWTTLQRQRYIRALLNKYPVPPIFLNQRPVFLGDETVTVIDGKQRCETIFMFIDNELEVDGELFSQQTKDWQRGFLHGGPSLSIAMTEFATIEEEARLYATLLTCGTQHSEEDIAQARKFIDSLGEGVRE